MKTVITIILTCIIVTNAKVFERKEQQRIVGGDPAPEGRFPFYAQYDGSVLCGSTLIHDDILIGAAHCGPPSQCGLLFDSIELGSGTSATVQEYVEHPQFNLDTGENDLLVMKLTNAPDINPIGYNTRSSIPVDDQPLTTIGFGLTSEEGSLSRDLMQVTLNYVPFEECSQFHRDDLYEDSMICAAAPNKDSCQGDSGGPLLTADDGSGDVVGIVSWGSGCGTELPGVYTRVSNYQQWIQEAICCMSSNPPWDCASTDCSASFGSVNCGGGGGGSDDEDSDGGGGTVINIDMSEAFCLSPDATAMVETKGKVSMKDIAVGDKVMTASGKYKTVFTIPHSHPDRLTSFLRVQTEMNENPLELTPLHMLFLQGKPNPLPAKDVKIGDVVQTLYHGPQKVTNVTVVTRNGFYNPVTADGTIVVDGIITSTYTSLNGGSYLEIAGRKWISFQSLFDMIASPFRTFCTTVSLQSCTQHQSTVVNSMMQFYDFFLKQNSIWQLFLLFVFVSFFGLTRIMLSPAGILAVLAFIGIIHHRVPTKPSAYWRKCGTKQSSKGVGII